MSSDHWRSQVGNWKLEGRSVILLGAWLGNEWVFSPLCYCPGKQHICNHDQVGLQNSSLTWSGNIRSGIVEDSRIAVCTRKQPPSTMSSGWKAWLMYLKTWQHCAMYLKRWQHCANLNHQYWKQTLAKELLTDCKRLEYWWKDWLMVS